jgi:transposase
MYNKDVVLRDNGCFNANYEKVSAGIFNSTPFFDKKDIVQVKYEMIRSASNAEGSITEIAEAFGFSRKSFYQANVAFKNGGLSALVPKKTGPKSAHKLNRDIQKFIEMYLTDNKNAKASDISAAIEIEMKIKIHPRTIYRYLKKN